MFEYLPFLSRGRGANVSSYFLLILFRFFNKNDLSWLQLLETTWCSFNIFFDNCVIETEISVFSIRCLKLIYEMDTIKSMKQVFKNVFLVKNNAISIWLYSIHFFIIRCLTHWFWFLLVLLKYGNSDFYVQTFIDNLNKKKKITYFLNLWGWHKIWVWELKSITFVYTNMKTTSFSIIFLIPIFREIL